MRKSYYTLKTSSKYRFDRIIIIMKTIGKEWIILKDVSMNNFMRLNYERDPRIEIVVVKEQE